MTAIDNEREIERESERKAAWAAVRCAASVGQSHRNLALLIGHSAVTSLKVGANADPPEFAALDLVGSYVIGEKKRIYKSRSFCVYLSGCVELEVGSGKWEVGSYVPFMSQVVILQTAQTWANAGVCGGLCACAVGGTFD